MLASRICVSKLPHVSPDSSEAMIKGIQIPRPYTCTIKNVLVIVKFENFVIGKEELFVNSITKRFASDLNKKKNDSAKNGNGRRRRKNRKWKKIV